jgi:hypothetical protein
MATGAKIKRKNPKALDAVVANIGKVGGSVVAVGFPRGQSNAYPDGTSVIEVAAKHVYGVDVPQRDFMTLAKPEVISRTKEAMDTLRGGGLNQKQIDIALTAAGEEGVSAIKQAITDLDTPPNAPGTLHPDVGGTNPKGKKSTNPLIDTEHMRDSVTYAVRKK